MRVVNGRIAEVGAVKPVPGEHVVDAHGLALAPGFIDPHNHSTEGLLTEPLASTQISQGITTVFVGQDGSSPWPIGEYLDKLRRDPAALNVLTAGVGFSCRSRDARGGKARTRTRRRNDVKAPPSGYEARPPSGRSIRSTRSRVMN